MDIPVISARGHVVTLARTDPRHLPGTGLKAGPGPAPGPSPASRAVAFPQGQETPTASFGQLFVNAFERVNESLLRSQALSQQIITDPDSVDVHDLSIAMAEANLAISMTKNIVDRAVRAYREVTAVR
jgi:flagellar hook-basal body complex protein FliE